MITIIFTKAQARLPRIQLLIQELRNPKKTYIRVPGESRSGICAFCSQFIFMEHDNSGRVVPLPVVGTHQNCVCQDLVVPIFKLGTRESIGQQSNHEYIYKTRRAKKGLVKRFEWLDYQSIKTKEKILGVQKSKYLKELPIERVYDARTKQLRTNDSILKTVKRMRAGR